MTDPNKPADEPKLAKNETIKADSNLLRGTIAVGLRDDSTGGLAADDTQLTKFHGIYQQDDRDLRGERRKAKQERAFAFMARVRVPGGVCSPQQWLDMDRFCTDYANGVLKLTTRQAFQLHGIIKKNLKKTIREINDSLMDTIAACGDVNRNVMCNPNPYQSKLHAEALETAKAISAHLTPATQAYHEIWLTDENGEKENVTPSPESEAEPIYGKTYLPRKFKIVIAVPPSNDVDVFAHDLGFIAIIEDDRIVGYTVTAGGGMGMSHGKETTFPRLADVLGFCTPGQVTDVAEKIVTTQRDFGDRVDRRHARLKYTIEDRGLDWFRGEVENRLGYALGQARPFAFDHNGDRYGWIDDENGNSHLTLFIQNGRVADTSESPMRTGLREMAQVHDLGRSMARDEPDLDLGLPSGGWRRYAPANSKFASNLDGSLGRTSRTHFQYLSTSDPSWGRMRLISPQQSGQRHHLPSSRDSPMPFMTMQPRQTHLCSHGKMTS